MTNGQIKMTKGQIKIPDLTNLCFVPFTDCEEIYQQGGSKDGIYKIQPINMTKPTDVYCMMSLGGQMIFQIRTDKNCEREDFFRGWQDYQGGFGSKDCDYWLGNDVLHAITKQVNNSLFMGLR